MCWGQHFALNGCFLHVTHSSRGLHCRYHKAVYRAPKGGKMVYEQQRAPLRRNLDKVDITGTKSTHLARQGVREIMDGG